MKRFSISNKLLKTIAIYAAIFLVIAIIGLVIFWNYMDAYEESQPTNVIKSYVYNLDKNRVADNCGDLFSKINTDVQSKSESLAIIGDVLSDGVNYARKVSECTDTKMVYVLSCDGQDIGTVVLSAPEKGSFGFAKWQVTEESFDFSFLMNESITVQIPEHYKVYANGKLLGHRSIVEKDIPIEVLKDFYADYDTLPYMVTYETGVSLGEVEITFSDAEGNAVTLEQVKDIAFILDNCSGAEKDTLDGLASSFINSYVRFSSNADNALDKNYQDVLSYIVPESALAERMSDALNGLKWVKDHKAEILSSTTHYRTRLAGGLYLYDISYEVTVTHQGNSTTTTENVRLLLSQTVEGLKVERMLNY